MKSLKRIKKLVFLFGLILYFQPIFAVKAIDYDLNKNQIIELSEYEAFLRDTILLVPAIKFDVNKDGNLNEKERIKANEYLSSSSSLIESRIEEFKIDSPSGIDIAKFSSLQNTDDKDILNNNTNSKKTKFLIRSSLRDVSIFNAQLPRQLAGHATISFIRDENTNNESLGFKGIIGYPISLNKNSDTAILPSLEINQFRNSRQSERDIDSLVFRVGLEKELDSFVAKTSYLSYGIEYATDSDFDLDVRGLNFRYEPIFLGLGQGANYLKGPFLIRWRGLLVGEAGKVFDTNNDPSLVSDDSYARIGGELDLKLALKQNPKFKFGLGYTYLDKVGGEHRARKLFSASASYDIDTNGDFTLNASYINGDRTIALEDEETWTLGVGIRY